MEILHRVIDTGIHVQWRVIAFATALMCLPIIASAQSQAVWTLEAAGPGVPKGTLDINALESLNVGDTFQFRVNAGAEPYPIRIDQISQHNNGDQTWYGSITNTGLDYALIITAGEQTAHLILTSPFGIFQLFGKAAGAGVYTGSFNRLEHVRDEVATTETGVPGADENDDTGAMFTITQNASHTVAAVGTILTFDLDFSYKGATTLPDQYVDIFFVLENTDLSSLPKDCEILESTEKQPVLSCYLGDFRQDQQKHLSFSVRTEDKSHPLVWSTALVGDVRNDVVVELYRDVVTDTDEDGISDYNEQLLGLDATNGLSPGTDVTAVIDVLVLYTPDIVDLYLGEVDTRVNQLFNVANKILEDSKTGIYLRAVDTQETGYIPAATLMSDLENITFRKSAAFNDLARKRELYGADLVVLFRTGEAKGLCGLANLGGKGTQGDFSASYHRDFAFSVINIDCMDDSVLAHEIGHNLGLVHSRREDPEGGTFPYAAGYGEDARFVSVMAFPDDFNVVNRLYRFSDPNRACGQFACGRDKSDADNGADAVSALKLVKYQVSRYYKSQESRIRDMKTVSNLTGPATAVIGLGAYSDESKEFDSSFPADKKVSLRMKITPLPEQIGRQFVTHVVIVNGKETLYQGNRKGELISWNGSLKTLEIVTEHRLMSGMELFDVLKDIDFRALGLVNTTVKIYAGYRMSDTRELLYGATPLSLHLGD